MVALFAALWLDSALRKGDHWTTERTYRVLQAAAGSDQISVDKLNYSVVSYTPEDFDVSVEVVTGTASTFKPSKVYFVFRQNGVLLSKEDTSDADMERINRMEWTTLEDRHGISWSRKWPELAGLSEANVIVKPTGSTRDDTTYSVNYVEHEKVKCVATIKVLNKARVVEDLAVTINDVHVPGQAVAGSIAVTEKLKAISFVDR